MSTEDPSPAEAIIGLYQRHANAWVNARLQHSELYEQAWLDRFASHLPSNGSVLDLGCGAGEPIANYLAGHGFFITGIDSSPAMIAMFRQRLPTHSAHALDMRSLSLNQQFDGILAWDSFFHLAHDDQRRMFPIFREHAAPGGVLMFTSGTVHGEAVGSLEGEPLYHASLDREEYRDLLSRHGFNVLTNVEDDPTCGGRTIWLAQLR